MATQLYPCLWFNNNAKEAADFYCTVFEKAHITGHSPMAVTFELEGRKVMGLNGGPMFTINPSISFFVYCQSKEEIDGIWSRLMEGGKAMMPLDKYEWSDRYGWVVDKYGMTWQLMLGDLQEDGQKIIPSFLFVGDQFGHATEAIQQYTSIFPNSKVHHLELYQAGGPAPAGHLMFGRFSLGDATFSAMDGPGNHGFQFNEGVSLVVSCDTQEEIDYYWDKLSEGGAAVQCGWLKDAYGVSWQVVPAIISELMSDPEKRKRVMAAIMGMKKLDIDALKNA